MVKIALIGVGYWGKNLARVFSQLGNLAVICDSDPVQLARMKQLYKDIKTCGDYAEILKDSHVDGVAVVTPAITHYAVAKKALEAGKHVFVEKPMTLSAAEGEELTGIAEKKDLRLMVGHLMEYHPAVEALKSLIDSGDLGRIYYVYSQRLNLGKIRQDENALWSFAPHDLSVILYLLGEGVTKVYATGESYLQDGIEDVVFVNLRYKDGRIANVHLSWLDPNKKRELTIVGSKKMAIFDDMQAEEKLKIYDKGADINTSYQSYGEFLTLRFGSVYIPKIEMKEPLLIECRHFIDCIENKRQPRSDGKDGLRVTRLLEAAQRSLKQGVPVSL